MKTKTHCVHSRITNVRDIPESLIRPTNWTMWRVIAYRGKSGDLHLAETFVRASSESRAIEIGKSALRMLGVRGRYVVNASRYYPWLDRKLAGYVGQKAEPKIYSLTPHVCRKAKHGQAELFAI